MSFHQGPRWPESFSRNPAVVEERWTHGEKSTLLGCTPAYGATFWHDCDLVIRSWLIPIQNRFLAVGVAMPSVMSMAGAQGRGTGTLSFMLANLFVYLCRIISCTMILCF